MRNKKYIGTFHYKKNGSGYVLVDIDGALETVNVFVDSGSGVFDGDTVETAVFNEDVERNYGIYGRVTRVLEHKQDHVVGTAMRDIYGRPYLTPREYVPYRIPIREVYNVPFEDGDLVKARIDRPKTYFALRVVPEKVYGRASSYEANLACMIDDLPFGASFSQEAVVHTRELLRIGNPADMGERRTYNDSIFSPVYKIGQCADTAYGIDCGEASTVIYIHIADVDCFLKSNTPLATEAFGRFRSVFDSSLSKYSLFPVALTNSLFNLLAPGEHPAITLTLEVKNDAVRLINVEESVVSNVTPVTMDHARFAVGVFVSGGTMFAAEIRRAYSIARNLREKRARAGGLTISKRNVAHHDEPSKLRPSVNYDASPFIFDELLYAAGQALAHRYVMEGAPGLYAGGEYPTINSAAEPPLYYRPLLRFADVYLKDFINTAISEAKKSMEEDAVVPYINFMLDGFSYSSAPVTNSLLGLKMYAPVAHPTEFFDAVIQQRAIRAMIHGRNVDLGDVNDCTKRSAAAAEADRALRIMNGIRYLAGKSGIAVTVVSDKEPFLVRTEGGILGELACSTPSVIERIKNGARFEVRTKEVSYSRKEIKFSF